MSVHLQLTYEQNKVEGGCWYQFLCFICKDTFLVLDLFHLVKDFLDLLIVFVFKGICGMSAMLSDVSKYLCFTSIFLSFVFEECAFFCS